jgi:hypothetical protein
MPNGTHGPGKSLPTPKPGPPVPMKLLTSVAPPGPVRAITKRASALAISFFIFTPVSIS